MLNTFDSDLFARLEKSLRVLREAVAQGENALTRTSSLTVLNLLSDRFSNLENVLSSAWFENTQPVLASLTDYLKYIHLRYGLEEADDSDSEPIEISDDLAEQTSTILSMASGVVEKTDNSDISSSLEIAQRDVKRKKITLETISFILVIIDLLWSICSTLLPDAETQEIIRNQETIIANQEELISLKKEEIAQDEIHNQNVLEAQKILEDNLAIWTSLLQDHMNSEEDSLENSVPDDALSAE